MSRFYDRLMIANRPLTLYDLVDIDKYRTASHSGYQKIRDVFRANPNMVYLAEDTQTGGTGMLHDIWKKAKVYAVDNVHHYLEAHNVTGADLLDMVKPLATVPSHEYMFIESRWSAAPNGSRAYGWFVSRMDSTEPGTRWQLQALLFVEWEKGRPLGPFVILTWYLDEEGRQVSRPGDPPLTEDMSTPDAPGAPGLFANFCEAVMYEMALARCVLAFSLGLLHCKNVSETEHQPSAKLQKAFQRRHRRPLTYYSTIDITPISRAIDQTVEASRVSLPKALHMCRGHFKTYRPEAPLFGSLTGQFWWTEHKRGHTKHGEVISDYRVNGLVDDGLAEHVWAGGTDLGPDPDLTERGRAAHAAVQDQFARALTARGLTPLQPQPHEPRYDLAWRSGSHLWVVEVKSTTVANEVRQCRCAIGQVQHYAVQLLANHEHVHPVIVLENRPADESLIAACERCGIPVLWPGVFDAIPTAPPL